jgi:glycosyltransferase involved in cell wall biosynthesis
MSAGAVYAHAKLVLMPSRYFEAYGRVAKEASLLKLPVVASARGGIPEAVSGDYRLVEQVEDIDEWVRSLRWMLQHAASDVS